MLGKYTKILLVVGFVTLVAGGIGLGIYFASKSNVTTTAGAVNVGGEVGRLQGLPLELATLLLLVRLEPETKQNSLLKKLQTNLYV